jgi:hypothetical protein
MRPNPKPPQKYLLASEVDAPLSTWNHYQIIKKIEREIQKYLHDLHELADSDPRKYDGYLLGIRVGYSIYAHPEDEQPKKYSMAFGYVAEDEGDSWLDHYRKSGAEDYPPGATNPLTDEFINQLYAEAGNYIRANISSSVDTFTVLLETAVSGSVKSKGVDCRKPRPNECNQGCNGRRLMNQRLDGSWFCTHTVCQ